MATETLIQAIPLRYSTRKFTRRPLGDAAWRRLVEYSPVNVSGLDYCRQVWLRDDAGFDEVFSGIIGSYGKIRGATGILVLVVPQQSGDLGKLTAGFCGEQVVLLATNLGVGSCWVAGTYHHKALTTKFGLGPDEAVASIIALGYGENQRDVVTGLLHAIIRKKSLADIASPTLRHGPPWLVASLEAVRLAPSAVNLQPWFFDGEVSAVRLSAKRRTVLTPIDHGIAMLHFALAAQHAGHQGEWQNRDGEWIYVSKFPSVV